MPGKAGFHGQAREQLQQLAGNIGATYSADLVQGRTTHLVCKRLIDCFGTLKYQKALEWGIQIVTYDWLLASSAAGAAVSEQDFKDDPPQALKPSPQGAKQHPGKSTLLQRDKHSASRAPDHSSDCQSTVQDAKAAAKHPTNQMYGEERQLAGWASSSSDIYWEKQQHMQCSHAAACISSSNSQLAATPSSISEVMPELPVNLCGQDPSKLTAIACRHPSTLDALISAEALARSLPEQQVCLSASKQKEQQQQSLAMLHQQSQLQLKQQHDGGFRGTCLTASADRAASADNSAASSDSFNFQQQDHTSQQASPCVESFLLLPGHQQQDMTCCTLPPPAAAVHQMAAVLQGCDPQNNAEVQQQGTADAQPDCTWQQQMERPQFSPSSLTTLLDSKDLSPPASPATFADADARQPQDDAAAVGGQEDAVEQTADTPPTKNHHAEEKAAAAPDHQNIETSLLLIPETQAEPGDSTWAAAELPQTPMSLKHYASQQPRVHQSFEAQKQQQSTEKRPDQTASDLATDDPTWSSQQPVADTQQHSNSHRLQQQHETHSVGSYSRLTASSGGHSTGLVRLRRRDGCRRQGRILVSELPEQCQLELEDSDCELCSHDGNHPAAIYHHEKPGTLLTSPAAAAAAATATRTAAPASAGSSRRPCSRDHDSRASSPVHSCSGSSLPAHSHGGAAPFDAGARKSPGAQCASVCDAASVVVAMVARPISATSVSTASSDNDTTAGGKDMPVMRLQFSVQQGQQQQFSRCSQHNGRSFTVADPEWNGDSSSTCDTSSNESSGNEGSSNEGSSTSVSGNGSRGSRLQLQGRRQRMEAIAGTAAAIRAKRQLLKQQQKQQQGLDVSAGKRQDQRLRADGLPANSVDVTCRRLQDLQGLRAASEVVAEAFPASGATEVRPAPFCVKHEPSLQLGKHAAQALLQLPLAAEPSRTVTGAEALLQDLKQRQQQLVGQDVLNQQQQQDLPSAEAMLHHFHRKQQQSKQQQQEEEDEEVPAAASLCAAEEIDDCLPPAPAASGRCAAGRMSTSSISSLATDMTSISRKVPLNLGTSGLQLHLADTTGM
jgi:hypothetical protein